MEPGRKLDEMVAEKVMGHSLFEYGLIKLRKVIARPDLGPEYWDEIPAYSKNISAAWLVVDKMAKMKGEACLSFKNGEGWTVFPTHHADSWGESVNAATAPHAICLAALKAVWATGPE